ncbi:macoilin-1 isoform X1 [Hypomesus transpacificus]|uniref:macoilin-1 isoform X1 n=1 Tax=Hypomesus transpacificus TaxID=137520 RepID=UPI001F0886F2|nr:macoilin-1 isoform X1 [Hypomesus transpacificus]
MKRRNADCSKLRRPLKRNRISEGIYSSTFLYLKFLVVWVLVLLADFVLEFRFEYLWPFWLFIRSVYDSFRYQGLAFSVFFVCVAFTSDIICLLFIPVQWLFFAAGTYVWVQYVWHTERGVCLPTVSLWILFVYIEAAIRFKDLKNFHVDLCRPFAAHCIGYPVVTLGFGFKSYVSYKMRLRKQREVQKENEFYMQLLQQALPPEQHMLQRQEREAEEAALARGVSEVDPPQVSQNGAPPTRKSVCVALPEQEVGGKERDKKQQVTGVNNNSILPPAEARLSEAEYMESGGGGRRLNNDLSGDHTLSESTPPREEGGGGAKNYKNASGGGVPNSSPHNHSSTNGSVPSASRNEKKQKCSGRGGAQKDPVGGAQKDSVGGAQKDPVENCIPNNQLAKPEALTRLEQDVRRLKAELQASRQNEADLRGQLTSLTLQDRGLRCELSQLRQDNELLQSKLHSAVQARQKDRQSVSQLEKRLKGEQEARCLADRQLADDRKRKKLEEASAARAVALAAVSRGECTDSLRGRIRELENEWKKLSMDMKLKEELIRDLEGKVQELRKYKENEKDTEVLMSALSAMQEKTQHLENSLSAETRIKLDLFSALGDARRQLEIAQGQTHQREQEIVDLKQKIAEVLAVMPSLTYSGDSSSLNSTSEVMKRSKQEEGKLSPGDNLMLSAVRLPFPEINTLFYVHLNQASVFLLELLGR